MKKTILVIAAHPDDEVLGCGGMIAGLAGQGAVTHIVFLADGVSSRNNNCDVRAELESRRTAARKAADILGVASLSFMDFPDNQLDSIVLLDIVKSVEAKINECQPDTVLTHHIGDVNVDHRRVHESVVVACRPQNDHPVKTLLFFEVPSSTEWRTPGSAPVFAPNWFVDISATLERKLAALEAYEAELRKWPHPRSIKGVEALARWRGATIGVEAAEAFVLGRQLS